jgi:hypothetical protein
MSAMIAYCALPDKSIGNLARSDGYAAVVRTIPDRFLTGFVSYNAAKLA